MKEIGKLLFCPTEHVLRKQAATRPAFNQVDAFGRAQHAPHFVKLPSQQSAENCMNVARRIEVPGFSELLGVSRIVTQFGIVEAKIHITREGNWSALANFLLDLLA